MTLNAMKERHFQLLVAICSTRVKIPPGCEDGQVFKLELDESILRWCTPDQERHFYAYVNIIPDDEFTREDLNVFSKAEISLSQLLLGGSVQVRGLRRDRLDVHVPPLHDLVRRLQPVIVFSLHYDCSSPDNQVYGLYDVVQMTYFKGTQVLLSFFQSRSLVARNEGVARSDGTDIGHHFIRLGLRLPRVLSQRQRSLMLAFAAATPLDQASEGAVKGLETDDSHRYEVGVVEPCAVARKFSTGQKKQRKDQEAEADVDEGSLWSRLRSSIFP
jgi:DnaJ-class molecular chaperone